VSAEPARVTLSTHVLDATAGRPAAGVSVSLEWRGAPGAGSEAAEDTQFSGDASLGGDSRWHLVATGTTDGDGRLRFPDAVPARTYRLTFGTGSYFAGRGVESFYPEVVVTFTASGGHYHVPLLLSPFAYSTYRGT
jgi:5-hydroxyisourate hydrolase